MCLPNATLLLLPEPVNKLGWAAEGRVSLWGDRGTPWSSQEARAGPWKSARGGKMPCLCVVCWKGLLRGSAAGSLACVTGSPAAWKLPGRAPGALQACSSGVRAEASAVQGSPEGGGIAPRSMRGAPAAKKLCACKRLRVAAWCCPSCAQASMRPHSLLSLLSREDTVPLEEQLALEAEAWLPQRSRPRCWRGVSWPGVGGPGCGEAAAADPSGSGCTGPTDSMAISATASGFAVFSRWLRAPPSLPAPLYGSR